MRYALIAPVAALTLALVACSGSDKTTSSNGPLPTPASVKAMQPIAMPTMAETKPIDYPGIHNAVAYHPGFVSGSQPDGEEGIKTLAAMGVKTIITVDGAEPDVETANKYGIRYIHLPIGYNGFDDARKMQLTRATRDAMENGPVYIHCHHGKHRSAGAAAAIATTLGWETPEEGVARMKVSGTAPNYKGLYACAANSTLADAATIDAVPNDFPSRWTPSGYVKGMNEIDEVFEHLKAIEKAGWATPKDHPDLVPASEAGHLADLYRLLHETDYVKRKPAGLGEMMQDANAKAQKLEDMIVAGEKDGAKISAQFKLVSASCKDCHAKYRD
ncbi:MAG: cytochrome c [Phycisphaerales bacterium]